MVWTSLRDQQVQEERREARLLKNDQELVRWHPPDHLSAAYSTFMQEYLDLNHMEAVPEEELDKIAAYYIPHHAILKNKKIRVVFNASQQMLEHEVIKKSLKNI